MVRVLASWLLVCGMVVLTASLGACSGGGGGEASCSDGAKNGNESDVDCGGSCGKCGLGRDCVSDFDCESGNCVAGICEPGGSGSCSDGTKNGYETDTDCGGTCPGCEIGQTCLVDADCESNNCDNGTCAPGGGETCQDGVLSGDESDVDCGGSCPGCDLGQDCNRDGDCTSGFCDQGTCAQGGVTCQDGQLNGDESDVDCGGSCPGCANGAICNANADCASNNCVAGTCEAGGAETCDDGALNQDETDVDCGGGICGPCGNGANCLVDGDCLSNLCQNGTCQTQQDLCPDDPHKTIPGVCGCGTPDIDSDSDGTMDCVDGCPADPAKTEPGLCGCGEPDVDTDSDADGVVDCADNCPETPNPDQADADGNGVGDACQAGPSCGNDCWGPTGCQTAAGRCIRFSCRSGDAGPGFCQNCMGPDWQEISYGAWLNEGYCADVIARYRLDQGDTTKCGFSTPSCCGDPASCAGGDNAWHWWDGANTRYTGPCLGCPGDVNCLYWDGTENSTMTRLTACQKVSGCIRLGWKFGADPSWACPAGYRMPTVNEWSRVLACIEPDDAARLDTQHDVATEVGGCGCKWNADWCGQPSIETIREGRMCGDFDQLHICVPN